MNLYITMWQNTLQLWLVINTETKLAHSSHKELIEARQVAHKLSCAAKKAG